jgi:5-methylcytosine-specific restriction endonuclease McrA
MTAACALDARVLVLNKLYSAVRVVDARRAFTLLCKGSAEVISVESGSYVSYSLHNWAEAAEFQRTFEHEEHDWVTTPSIVVAVPKIIRLLGYERLPREPVKLNRRNIYARDHSQCQYCGRNFSTKELTLDHVVPRVQGGENSWTNLVCACVRCNARKGGRTPAQARMKLIREPVKPRRNPAITLRLGSPKYQSWKAFLDEAYWTVELQD